MTEPNAQPQTTPDPNAPFVNPQAVYIKDCSFEAPSGPSMSPADGTPSKPFSAEHSGQYRGLYHVLGGRLAPLDGVQVSVLQ